MKLQLRPGHSRCEHAGWLKGSHSFPSTPFGPLVVLNEDQIAPMNGFPLHPHKNYEIFTYILSGELTHTDSMGRKELCRKGSVQFISAGRGIQHGEFNTSDKDHCKALQVWVAPRNLNTTPNYQIKKFPNEEKMNRLCPFIVPSEIVKDNLIGIDQDFFAFSSILEKEKTVVHSLHPNRQVYIHLPDTGDVTLNVKSGLDCLELKAGDGVYITATNDEELMIEGKGESLNEFVLFDMVQEQSNQ